MLWVSLVFSYFFFFFSYQFLKLGLFWGWERKLGEGDGEKRKGGMKVDMIVLTSIFHRFGAVIETTVFKMLFSNVVFGV